MQANEYDRAVAPGNRDLQWGGPWLGLRGGRLKIAVIYHVTHYGCATIKAGEEAQHEWARIFGQRVAVKALELFGG
jgi:SLT domain-containing protein